MSITVDLCGYDKLEDAGGPVVWLRRFPAALRDQGIDVRIKLLSWHDPSDGVLFQCLQEQGFDVVGKRVEDTETSVRWLLQQISRRPPDVFVPNLVTPAFYAARWARAAGIPTVGILHSDDAFYRGIQDTFVFGERNYALSAIISVSRELHRQVDQKHPRWTQPFRIPYGVPTPDVMAERMPDHLRLGYVGRLAEAQKRISDVTHAFCRVTSEISGTSATIFGDGPDRANVERILNSESGLPVTMAGNVPSGMIQQTLVQQCDVIVLLSDYEGLPISLLEAMACGVVPVCLNISSGIPELIEDGVNGLLVEDRHDEFVDAIRRLNEDPAFWQQLSCAARQRVKKENSLEQCADSWAQMLASISGGPRSSKKIRMPRRLKLPSVHPDLAAEDQRNTGFSGVAARLAGKSIAMAGRVKRMVSTRDYLK